MTIANRARFFFAGIVIFGLSIMLLGISSSYTLAFIAMMLAATGTPMSDLMILIMIQEEFPANQVGKVYSLRLTIASVGYSLGLLIAAYLFQWMFVSTGIFLLGLMTLLVGLAGVIRFHSFTLGP